MQNDHRSSLKPRHDKPRLRLPFENRKMDLVTWCYVHRLGVCITVTAFLIFGIAFVSCKISQRSARVVTAIYMDPDRPEEEQRRPEMHEVQPIDYSGVSNRASNENAELNSGLRDAQGTNASDLYEEAGKLNERMNANRAAFEDGLNRVDRMRNAPKQSDDGDERRQTARAEGSVTVSYSFASPVRSDEVLTVPAYMCQGGGTVVVDAVLDVNGYVTSATVDRARSTSDECMRSTAVKAALGSRFNIDTKAPAKHRGTITYVFIPQ